MSDLQYQGGAGGSSDTFQNGLTKTGSDVELGGAILQDTILSFDPDTFGFTMGLADNSNTFFFGNVFNDGNTYFGVNGVDGVSIDGGFIGLSSGANLNLTATTVVNMESDGDTNIESHADLNITVDVDAFITVTNDLDIASTGDTSMNAENTFIGAQDSITVSADVQTIVTANNGSVAAGDNNAVLQLSPYAATPISLLALRKNQNWEAGYASIDNGAKVFANLYYGTLNASNVITDITRVEANANAGYCRYVNSPTAYNGVSAYETYAQLEYAKVADDGQTTGTTWTINTDGASLFVGGVRQFRIKNSVPAFADDAAAVGGGLVTGDVYQTTTLGSTFLKIVP